MMKALALEYLREAAIQALFESLNLEIRDDEGRTGEHAQCVEIELSLPEEPSNNLTNNQLRSSQRYLFA